MMYQCNSCKKTFKDPVVKYDYHQVGEDDFEDAYFCPFCHDEGFFKVIPEEGDDK